MKLAIDGGIPTRTKPFSEWPIYGEMEEKLLLEVLHSGKWGGTGRVKLPELEKRFAAVHGAKHAIPVVNGTVAITIALLACGVGPGDEVIVPPYTFFATASAPLMFGAIPVFADVEEDTMLIDPDKVEALITPKTKAIVPVHIGGCPANMARLKQIAKKHNLRIVEDAAQAIGASWDGQGVGTLGDCGTFSFQSSKNINSGEGGMIITNDDKIAEIAWSLVNAGRIQGGLWYQHERVGWNLRMTEFQAAILLGQLSRLEEQMKLRERNAEILTGLLQGVEGVQVMRADPQVTRHAYHLYMFRMSSGLAGKTTKKEFCDKLRAEGIPVAEGYVPLNRNRAIIDETRKLTGEDRTYPCPVAEAACENDVLWLHQNMLLGDQSDMKDIADAVQKVVQSI